MIRTVLVTEARHKTTGEVKIFIGRYDPVSVSNLGYIPFDSYKAQYEMSDAEFVKHGKFKQKVKED